MGLITIDNEIFEYDDSSYPRDLGDGDKLYFAAQSRDHRPFDLAIHGTLSWTPLEPKQCVLIINDKIVNHPLAYPLDASAEDVKQIQPQFCQDDRVVCVKRPMEGTNIFVYRIWFKGKVWTEYVLCRGRSAFSSQFCSNYWKIVEPYYATMNFGDLFKARLGAIRFPPDFSDGHQEYIKLLDALTLQDFGIQEDATIPYAYIDAWSFSRYGFEANRQAQHLSENVQYLYSVSPLGKLVRWSDNDEFFARWPKYCWRILMEELATDQRLSTWLIIGVNNTDSKVCNINSIVVMNEPTKRISDAIDGGPCPLYKMFKYFSAAKNIKTKIGRYSRFPQDKIIDKEEALRHLDALNVWMPHEALIWTILCLLAFQNYPNGDVILDSSKIDRMFDAWTRVRPRNGNLVSQCTCLAAHIYVGVLCDAGLNVTAWREFKSDKYLLDNKSANCNQVRNIIEALRIRGYDEDYKVATELFAL